MAIPEDLLNALMKDYKNPEDLIGETGLLKQLTKQLLERAMQAEMTEHLGYEKNSPAKKNARTISSSKKSKHPCSGSIPLNQPADRRQKIPSAL